LLHSGVPVHFNHLPVWGFSYYFRSADNEQSIFKAPAGALNAQRRNGRSTADPDQEKLFRSVAA